MLRKLVKVNKKLAIVMASDMLLAGVDTTAVYVTNILYCLAKNPEKQEKLRNEILKILPEKSSKLTTDNMKNLPYLRAVIKETFRIKPVVSGTARQIHTETVLAGYKIPSGTHVIMPSFFEMESPKQFPQPEKFIPERWLRDNTDASCPHAKTANPFSFLPFGFGARMCKLN
jgi:cytochrome P450 family 12